MARFRIKTVFTRMQQREGSDPKQPTYDRLVYPAGSVIEPTNAEYAAFKDVMERVDDSTPLTELGAPRPQAAPNAPYDPDAAAAAGTPPAQDVAGTVSGTESAAAGAAAAGTALPEGTPEPPTEGSTSTTRRR